MFKEVEAACMTAKGPGPTICVDGHVNVKKYIEILTNVVSFICLFLLYIAMTCSES